MSAAALQMELQLRPHAAPIGDDPTLNDLLAHLGYTTRPGASLNGYSKDILCDGAVVMADMSAGCVWDWLRESGQWPREQA